MTNPSSTTGPADNTALWRQVFAEGHPKLQSYQRINKRLPSAPRCKMCSAPFRGIGGWFMRLTGRAPSNRNPRYCSRCDQFIRAFPGGAEVEMSMLFVDVRGSTALAEKLSPTEYSRVINRFYSTATQALIDTDGFVIDVVGDEVVGLYPPGFSGVEHARKAVDAARRLLRAGDDALPMGIGVHCGVSFIGTVMGAEEGIADVRAMGDTINVAARLASQAKPNEALISEAVYVSAKLDEPLEARQLELKGKTDRVAVRVMRDNALPTAR